MTISWDQPGYPPRHYAELKRAQRTTVRVCVITSMITILMLVGCVLDVLNTLFACVVLSVCLLITVSAVAGLYDATRQIRIVPYFDRQLGEIGTYLVGHTLAKYLNQLDQIASEHNVTPISSFGFSDDLVGEQLAWYKPNDALESIDAIEGRLQETIALEGTNALPRKAYEMLLDDLEIWRDALSKANRQKAKFCVLLLHGNSTSGHEWSLRKGAAF